MSSNLKKAVSHSAVVAMFIFISSVIPALIAVVQQNAKWMWLAAPLNMLLAGVNKFQELQNQ